MDEYTGGVGVSEHPSSWDSSSSWGCWGRVKILKKCPQNKYKTQNFAPVSKFSETGSTHMYIAKFGKNQCIQKDKAY